MANEKSGGGSQANTGGSANKGPSRSSRRRMLRSKRRARKQEEGSEPRESRTQPNAPKTVDKSVRENRERRRRRRLRAKQRGQGETTASPAEDSLKDLPPLVPAFVYTHVIRPSMRDSFEFRTEHFSKVTRKLEDFHIDLSPLYPDGGDEIKGVAYIAPADRAAYEAEFGTDDLEDDEVDDLVVEDDLTRYDADGYEDPDWDAEESADAARLDGAIGSDFYSDMDDSAVDEYPEEDIDA